MKLVIPLLIAVLVFAAAAAAVTPPLSTDSTGGMGANESKEPVQNQQAGANESGQIHAGTPNETETGLGPGPDQGQQIGQNVSTPGSVQGPQEQMQQEIQNLGENETIRVQERVEIRVQNASELQGQARLLQLAQREKEDQGLFGWLWK